MENNEKEKSLALRDQNHVSYIESKKDVITKMLGLEKASPQDLEVAFTQFKRTGLDPVTRQIYAMINNGKLSIMASIDGLRLIAERTGAYEGQTAPQWCGDDGKWVDVWLKKETPKAARIGVYKTKFREPLYAVALFDEYAGRHLNDSYYDYDDRYHGRFKKGDIKNKKGDLTHMWAKMPALMIAKVAEALALRKGFPNEMSGIYSSEEMDQAGHDQNEKEVNHQAAIEGHKTEQKAESKKSDSKIDFDNYVIKFGKKMNGKRLADFSEDEHRGMLTWLNDQASQKGESLSGAAKEYNDMATAWLVHLAKSGPKPIDTNELFPE